MLPWVGGARWWPSLSYVRVRGGGELDSGQTRTKTADQVLVRNGKAYSHSGGGRYVSPGFLHDIDYLCTVYRYTSRLRVIQSVGPSSGSVLMLVGSRADHMALVAQDYLQKLWERAREVGTTRNRWDLSIHYEEH